MLRPKMPSVNDLEDSKVLEQILIDFPNLKICVPHLGFDEISAYRQLIEKYDNLWLDTTLSVDDLLTLDEIIFRTARIRNRKRFIRLYVIQEFQS